MNGACRALACAAVLATAAAGARAQEDYRHLDQDRPLRVEDAYPVKFLEWEWEIGAEAATVEGGTFEGAGILEIKLGALRNLQVGIEVHGELARSGGVTTTGAETVTAHALYNLNQEGAATPAFALRADVSTPGTGAVGRDEIGARLKGILTRTLGRARVHLNAAHEWAAAVDGGNLWSGGIAFDRPLGLAGRAVMGDVFVEAPVDGSRARVWTELGARIQAGLATVLDIGLGTRIDEWEAGRANLAVTVGLSRVFGIGALVSVPPYPNPRIN